MQDLSETQFKFSYIPLKLDAPELFNYPEKKQFRAFIKMSLELHNYNLFYETTFQRLWDISTSLILQIVFGKHTMFKIKLLNFVDKY